MKQIWLHIRDFRDANDGDWPGEIEDVKAFVGDTGYWDSLMANRFTLDSPGYEYIKPTPLTNPSETVVLYQLRSGEQANDLEVILMDGSVASIGHLPQQ